MAISLNRANRQQKSNRRAPNRFRTAWALSNVSAEIALKPARFRAVCPLSRCKQSETGRKSLIAPLKYIIPKTLCEMPKNHIIWLWPLSGRGYQVMSRFCPGVPDLKVAYLWWSVSVKTFSTNFKTANIMSYGKSLECYCDPYENPKHW